MPKDALTIYRAAEELDFLIGGKVDKVTMPNADTLILLVHTSSGNFRLLLSCNPSLPRAHITTAQYKNPEVASGTLMYFRKRLVGAAITAVRKDKCERLIVFEFSALDELRERVKYSLYAELTGKCANIVFVEQNGTIGNCLRRISAEADGKRAVFPGLRYALPNPTGRVDIFDGEELKRRVAEFDGSSLRTALNKCVAGLAVTTVDEILFSLGLDADAPVSSSALDAFTEKAQALYSAPISPVVTFEDGKPVDYYIVPYASCGGDAKRFDTVNEAMDAYYSALFFAADLNARLKPLRAAVRSAITKNTKRRDDAAQKLLEARAADTDRQLGELITANIYRIKRGDASVTVQNWFDENGGDITIKLDPTKNAQQNAAAHFKAYTKKKRAAEYARDALKKAEDMLFVLDGISAELDLCSAPAEINEVRDELVSLGLMRPEKTRLKQKPAPSQPYAFFINGAELVVGKNHAQNDRITKSAAKSDTWLHVKDAHGCHAVLKTPSPTDKQITRAAEIAAYYSQARSSENVAVDYTLVKYVYPHGGGRVEYKNHKTVYVTPSLPKKEQQI